MRDRICRLFAGQLAVKLAFAIRRGELKLLARDQAATVYVRTYDLELGATPSGPASLEAVVRHVRAYGPMVRVELDLVEDRRSIEAHIPRERSDQLTLVKGQRLFVSPANARIFAEPERRPRAG